MFQKRILVFIVLISALFFVIISRLFSSQVISSSYYVTQARKYATRIELIEEPRGKILDRNGNVLVSNKLNFDLYFTPYRYFNVIRSPEGVSNIAIQGGANPNIQLAKSRMFSGFGGNDVSNRLTRLLKIKPDDLDLKIKAIEDRIIAQAESKPSERTKKQYIKQQYRNRYRLLSGVSLDQALQIESHPELFPGFNVTETVSRHYVYNELACHVIGYIGALWKEEYDKFTQNNQFREMLNPQIDESTYQALLEMGEFKNKLIGRTGIERLHNRLLIGKYGVQLNEYDYSTRQKEELSRTNSLAPAEIILTIDLALQRKMEEALKGRTGAAIVMDIQTGEILAMASAPAYNPNLLQPPVDREAQEYLTKSPLKPGYNRAIAGEYALGSVFKIVTGIAGLEEGKITPYTPFYCNGYFSPSYKKFRCWILEHGREHGSLSIEEGLKHSCNVFFFNVGKVTGGEAINKWADKFGFGKYTGIDIAGENKGRLHRSISSTDTSKWSLSEGLNLSIGQGDLMGTPLQVVRMMAAVANGGVLVTPRIIKNIELSPDSRMPFSRVEISDSTLKHIRNGLYKVTHSEGGTAYGTGMRNLPVAGKTSTAEVWGKKSHGWFAGFAPYDKPRIAFVVVFEHGGKGSEVGAPAAVHFIPEALAIVAQ